MAEDKKNSPLTQPNSSLAHKGSAFANSELSSTINPQKFAYAPEQLTTWVI